MPALADEGIKNRLGTRAKKNVITPKMDFFMVWLVDVLSWGEPAFLRLNKISLFLATNRHFSKKWLCRATDRKNRRLRFNEEPPHGTPLGNRVNRNNKQAGDIKFGQKLDKNLLICYN